MLLEINLIFFSSFVILLLNRKLAKRIGLLDKPNARKLHNDAVPLVGGISIYLILLFFLSSNPNLIEHNWLYLLCISILTTVGVIDDKIDLNFKIRLIIQTFLTIFMMKMTNIELQHLGDMFGIGDISLGWSSSLITVLAIIGATSAFNMIDGLDGLLGGLSIITFSSLTYLLTQSGHVNLAYLCIILITAILPYLLLNLGILGHKRKIFMGDAGSMMIGFTVIWVLLDISQNQDVEPLMRPVTALWLIALPLMDMVAIMIRRIRKGVSPFKPDRKHLHHIFQDLGLSEKHTLLCICFIAAVFAGFGIYGEIQKISEFTMFRLFILCFICYSIFLNHALKSNKLTHSIVTV